MTGKLFGKTKSWICYYDLPSMISWLAKAEDYESTSINLPLFMHLAPPVAETTKS